MPGWGYRIIKRQPQRSDQRVAALIGDLQQRTTAIERSRPATSVSDGDPTAPGALGALHLNDAAQRLWVYTSQGWITADAYRRYAVDSGPLATASTTLAAQGPSLAFTVPEGGGFVHVYMEMETWSDSAGGQIEIHLSDGVEFAGRVALSTPPVGDWGQATTQAANPLGGTGGMSSWLVYYANTGGSRTLTILVKSVGGHTIRTRTRELYTLVWGGNEIEDAGSD